MNNNTTSQFMDKQVMDFSNSQSHNGGGDSDFVDLINHPSPKKDEIFPSYDFMPIRPAIGSSSPSHQANRSSNFGSAEEDASLKTWNSLDSKTNASLIKNYRSLDVDKPSRSVDLSLVLEIDKTMKKYIDNLIHAMDNVSEQISQLETRTRSLENFVDDLKVFIGNNHGSSDGKIRQMENILREVQTGVHIVIDKQDVLEAQVQTAKMHFSELGHVKSQDVAHSELAPAGVSSNQQFSAVDIAHLPPTLPSPNAPLPSPPTLPFPNAPLPSPPTLPFPNAPLPPPPTLTFPNAPLPPPPQQTMRLQGPFPSQYPQNQILSVPQQESYFPNPGSTPEKSSQPYQVPPHQHQPLPPQPQHQHQSPPQPQHQHQSPPQPQYSQPPSPSRPHPSFSAINPSFSAVNPSFSAINPTLSQISLSHRPEETPYPPPQTYPSGIRPPPHSSTGITPPPSSEQFYISTDNLYEPQPNRHDTGYSNSYVPSSGHTEPYPYNSPSQYGVDSPRKQHQISSTAGGQSGSSGYPQLPTARILPQAIPTASTVGVGSGSGSSGNKVPIDDVVDKVTLMGFPRDQVRATVRKLTENGQSVDLNVVLDKLMNDGDGQAPRDWFGR